MLSKILSNDETAATTWLEMFGKVLYEYTKLNEDEKHLGLTQT